MYTLVGVIVLSIIFGGFGFIWEKISIKNINYDRYVNKKIVFPMEEILITTVIINKKLLPLPWIEIYSELPEAVIYKDQVVQHKKIIKTNIYKVVTSLFPYQKVTRRNKFHISKRGYYSIDDLQITIGDFIGFSKGIINVNSPLRITVYPEIKNLDELIIPNNNPQGEISVNRWIIPDPIEIKGVREYTPYDSFNTIDWKATAKTGELQVKEFDFTSDTSLMILLNVQCDNKPWRDVNEEVIDLGVTIAASIMNESLEADIPVGFSTNGILNSDYLLNEDFTTIAPDLNPSQGEDILDSLAKVSYMCKTKIEDIIENIVDIYDKYTTIAIVTPYLNDKTIEKINRYSSYGYNIKLILVKENINTDLIDEGIEIYQSKEFNLDNKEINYV